MIVYLRSTREVDGYCIICRKHRAMNTASRSLKQQVMEEEGELLTVGSLALWFVLLLKLDDVLFIISFGLPGELAPFVFWLVPFLEANGIGEVVALVFW